MSLVMNKESQWWYGHYTVNGVRRVLPLGVKIEGVRPKSLRDKEADPLFERSRILAEEAYKRVKAELTEPARAASRLQRIHEIQVGTKLKRMSPSALSGLYSGKQRKHVPSPAHIAQGVERIGRFCAFLEVHYPNVSDLAFVTNIMALEFMDEQQKRGVTFATLNRIRETLVAAFNEAKLRAGLTENPFAAIIKYDDKRHQVHRRPFTTEQIARILTAAKADPTIGIVIVTALCTGMRRKDCALLRWIDVNLEEGMIKLHAYKTGVWISIPLFPILKDVLERMPRTDTYCFPAAAALYLGKDGSNKLTKHFNRVLETAEVTREAPSLTEVGGKRLRRPSVSGFAACKTTFVTIALNAGIPEMMLRKVVGNKTLELVLENYYQLDQQALKAQFLAKMPAALTGAVPAEKMADKLEKLIELAGEMKADTWEQGCAEIRKGLIELRGKSLV